MTFDVKPVRLYNQDTVPKTWGVWRWQVDGVVTPDEYHYDTQTLGPYKFPEFYGWVKEFYTKKSAPPTRILYKYLYDSQAAVACLFVNNSYVARVYTDCIEYIDLDKPTLVDVRYFEEGLIGEKYLMNIGYVKTPLSTFVVAQNPWSLQYDVDTKKAYIPRQGWVSIKGNPEVQYNMPFDYYKALLTRDGVNAVYHDLDTDEYFYI